MDNKNLKVGEKVWITKKWESYNNWALYWNEAMNQTVGKSFKIIEIKEDFKFKDNINFKLETQIVFDGGNYDFTFPIFILSRNKKDCAKEPKWKTIWKNQ